jgi:CRAL/TRIO domain
MKGIKDAIADPIEPVCPEDARLSVKALIQEHSDKINQIREGLVDHPYYDSNKHDDLWILRFYLSHKKVKQAIGCAKSTLNFRNEHKLDEKDIRAIAPHQVPSGNVRAYLNCWKDDAMVFTHPHPQRGVICFLKLVSMDQHKVVATLTEDHWLDIFLYCSEWSFQWLDYVTRTTGRLTKSVRFIELKGFTLSGFNRECSRRDGKVMTLMEDCYPQLLESIFAVNAPIFIDIIWNFFKLIAPKRVIDKFDIVKPLERDNDVKKFHRHISENDLPDFLGGKNPIPPHDWETYVASTATSSESKGKDLSEC